MPRATVSKVGVPDDGETVAAGGFKSAVAAVALTSVVAWGLGCLVDFRGAWVWACTNMYKMKSTSIISGSKQLRVIFI